MRELHLERRDRPVTTMDLEELLVVRSGRYELVDAFHRFVYGFPDPDPAHDLWLKDDPAHTGAHGWGARSGTRPTCGFATPTTAKPSISQSSPGKTTGSTP
jgi:hypothetical protein